MISCVQLLVPCWCVLCLLGSTVHGIPAANLTIESQAVSHISSGMAETRNHTEVSRASTFDDKDENSLLMKNTSHVKSANITIVKKCDENDPDLCPSDEIEKHGDLDRSLETIDKGNVRRNNESSRWTTTPPIDSITSTKTPKSSEPPRNESMTRSLDPKADPLNGGIKMMEQLQTGRETRPPNSSLKPGLNPLTSSYSELQLEKCHTLSRQWKNATHAELTRTGNRDPLPSDDDRSTVNCSDGEVTSATHRCLTLAQETVNHSVARSDQLCENSTVTTYDVKALVWKSSALFIGLITVGLLSLVIGLFIVVVLACQGRFHYCTCCPS